MQQPIIGIYFSRVIFVYVNLYLPKTNVRTTKQDNQMKQTNLKYMKVVGRFVLNKVIKWVFKCVVWETNDKYFTKQTKTPVAHAL